MTKNIFILLFLIACAAGCSNQFDTEESLRLQSLNNYWSEVSRTVGEGDFEGYTATTHPDGVLVDGTNKKSHLLSKALQNWEINFINTSSGKINAGVEFRFSQRLGDASTAHETGMFKYWEEKDGKKNIEYIHLEALLVKKEGKWKILMEYQKSRGTLEDWNKLKK